MPAKRLVPLVVAAVVVAVAWFAAVAQAVPSRLIALGAGTSNTLYGFAGNDLNSVTVVPVTGLGANNLVGISFRPADGQLYGVGISGNTESVFRIDAGSGAATLVGSGTQATIGGALSYGIDFNPVVDRIRVVSGLESDIGGTNINNFRVNPVTGAFVAADVDLNYGALPGGEAGNRPLATIAYDRNVLGATASTVFGLTVAANDSLVRLGGVDSAPSPNGGVLTQIGPLGVDTTLNAGLDIDPATGEAYAVLQVGGASGLYGIDLTTGTATLVGKVAGGAIAFNSLAIAPPPAIPPICSCGPPDPPPAQPPASSPPALTTLQSLTIKPSPFVAATKGGPIAARKAAGGAKVSYTLSAAATVTFVVEKSVPRKRGSFKRLKPTFTHSGKAGANSFRFSGRLGGKALGPGRYRLTASVGTSSRSAGFKIRLR